MRTIVDLSPHLVAIGYAERPARRRRRRRPGFLALARTAVRRQPAQGKIAPAAEPRRAAAPALPSA